MDTAKGGFWYWTATLLSWVLVPLLLPVYAVLLMFNLSWLDYNPVGVKVVFTAVVLALNTVLPMLVVAVLMRAGKVHDPGLNNRTERMWPYLITAICYALTAWFFHYRNAPDWVWLFFAGGVIAALVNLIVNFWWKISAHCAGIAGIVALLVHMERSAQVHPVLPWLLVAIFLAGALGSSRVYLGRHTLLQVLAGYAVGFCAVYFIM